jgi:hypothetical protein
LRYCYILEKKFKRWQYEYRKHTAL